MAIKPMQRPIALPTFQTGIDDLEATIDLYQDKANEVVNSIDNYAAALSEAAAAMAGAVEGFAGELGPDGLPINDDGLIDEEAGGGSPLDMFDGVSKQVQSFKSLGDNIKSSFNSVKNTVNGAVSGVKSVINSASNIKNVIKQVGSRVSGVVGGVVNGVRNAVGSVVNGVRNAVGSVVNGVGNIVNTVKGGIQSVTSNIGNAFKNFSNIGGMIKQVGGAVSGVVKQAGNIAGAFKNVAAEIGGVVYNLKTNALADMKTIAGMVGNIAGDFKATFTNISGLGDQIGSMCSAASKLNLPGVFTAMANSVENEMAVIGGIIKSADAAIRNTDFDLLKEMADSKVLKDIKNVVPDLIDDVVSNFKLDIKIKGSELSDSYDKVVSTFTKIDKDWNNAVASVTGFANDVQSIAKFAKAPSIDLDRLIQAKCNINLKDIPNLIEDAAATIPKYVEKHVHEMVVKARPIVDHLELLRTELQGLGQDVNYNSRSTNPYANVTIT
jgi:phage-related protein